MAVFGYPRSHDNDATRAVAAGLRAIELSHLERTHTPDTPDIRIGLHTGLALVHVVGSGTARHVDIAGDTPAIATRIEGHAPLNELLISEATARMVEHEFELDGLGPQQLKGIDTPVDLSRVVGRRENPVDDVRTRLVGRHAELAVLTSAWEQTMNGDNGTVVVTAPAGVGKTCLVGEFGDRLREEGNQVISLRCSELLRTTALHPVIRGLRTLLDWTSEDGSDALLAAVDTEFADLPIAAAPELVADLLGVQDARRNTTLALDPSRRRALLLQVMVSWFERRASISPCCLVIEDLHWADPSTLEFLAPLVTGDAVGPLMIVATSRPGVSVSWIGHAKVAVLELHPLNPADAAELIDEIAGGALPDVVRRKILDQSDAIPLFITELTRTVVASGLVDSGSHGDELQDPSKMTEVPSSLLDSLMVRLEQLGSSRSLASIAATIGRTFDLDLLAEVADADGPIDADVERMVSAGVLVRMEEPGHRRVYTFGHALVREAAYQSITRRTRREWHGRIADAVGRRAGAVEPTLLAHHLTEAGRNTEAIDMWGAAARADFAAAAYDESIVHFRRGLALIDQVDPAVAPFLEFPLQLGIGLAYATRLGYVSSEAEQAYQRADALAQGLSTPEGFPAVLGLWAYYQVRSDPVRRRELGERCHRLAELSDDPAIRLEGVSALSTTLAFEGETTRASTLIAEGLALFDEHHDRDMAFYMPQHPAAGFCGIGGPLAWSQGDARLASHLYTRCTEFAENPRGVLGPFTSGYSHTFAAWLCALRGDYEAAARHAQSAIEVATEYGFLVWHGAALPHLGIAVAMLGDTATGIDMTTQGIALWRASGSGLFVSYYEHGLGLSHEAAGDLEAALRAADAGVEHSELHAERFHLAELHRLRGRLHEGLGSVDDAIIERRRAASVAASQGARLFELHALHDLASSGAADPSECARHAELATLLDADIPIVAAARSLSTTITGS
jgi:tetratricopeptide (TPR) repeat protein